MAGAIFYARESFSLVASNPLLDHLSGSVPATGCLADAAGLPMGSHNAKSCLDPVHSVDFPVGQVCHSRSSFWIRYFDHPFGRRSSGALRV